MIWVILVLLLALIIFTVKIALNSRFVVRLFKSRNVIVTGLKGTGKDVVFSHVIQKRKREYVSNTKYNARCIDFDKYFIGLGGNTYKDFADGTLKPYAYPLADGVDFYLADCGVYFPSTYQSELCKRYPDTPLFMALSRHLGDCNVHLNCQNLGRIWDKLREMSDCFILCRRTRVFFGKIAITKMTVYSNAQSCIEHRLPFPVFLSNKKEIRMRKREYQASYGDIKNLTIVTMLSKRGYDTRVFKKMLADGSTPAKVVVNDEKKK